MVAKQCTATNPDDVFRTVFTAIFVTSCGNRSMALSSGICSAIEQQPMAMNTLTVFFRSALHDNPQQQA